MSYGMRRRCRAGRVKSNSLWCRGHGQGRGVTRAEEIRSATLSDLTGGPTEQCLLQTGCRCRDLRDGMETCALAVNAYLAGPDVFLSDARAQATRKIAICARHHIVGRSPLNEDLESLDALPGADAWLTIFHKNLAMMEACDIIIANLTPFRGPSADAGTLIEVGWFLGRGRPIFGYSNSAASFASRSRRHLASVPDAVAGMAVEGFGLADNLMIPGAVLDGSGHPMVLPPDEQDRPFEALDVFERCVAHAAAMVRPAN
jgi:nucleoside 2-deoxyribosyltransferase